MRRRTQKPGPRPRPGSTPLWSPTRSFSSSGASSLTRSKRRTRLVASRDPALTPLIPSSQHIPCLYTCACRRHAPSFMFTCKQECNMYVTLVTNVPVQISGSMAEPNSHYPTKICHPRYADDQGRCYGEEWPGLRAEPYQCTMVGALKKGLCGVSHQGRHIYCRITFLASCILPAQMGRQGGRSKCVD